MEGRLEVAEEALDALKLKEDQLDSIKETTKTNFELEKSSLS